MTHKEYKILQIYNQICVLQENNRNGRYDDKIKALQIELDELLQEVNA